MISLLMLDDESAFASIYEKYADQVYKYTFFFLKDTGWSEDVVQEVFVKLWASRYHLKPEGNLWTYLYVITKRASLNKLRTIRHSPPELDKLWTTISHSSDCSHEKLIAKELSSQLEDILRELPERQREVFELSRFDGYTYQEIADVLHISPSTVRNHMIQALKTIRMRTIDYGYLTLFFWLFT